MDQYLRAYVSYQQDNWTDFLTLAEFATNNHLLETTNMSPFQASYGRLSQMTFGPLQHGETTNEDQANRLAREMSQVFNFLKAEMFRAQKIQEKMANLHRTPAPRYAVGDYIWLSTRNIETKRPSTKLDWKQIGPYRIQQIVSPYAYELTLPSSMKVHPVFHVSLLISTVNDPIPGQITPIPPPVEVEGESEWEVEDILDSRKREHRLEYLVKYVGYEEPSWQPSEEIEHAPNVRKILHEQYPSKPCLSGGRPKRGT